MELAIRACTRLGARLRRTQAYFRELFVLRRTPDGWRIHKYMFSQNPAQAQHSSRSS